LVIIIIIIIIIIGATIIVMIITINYYFFIFSVSRCISHTSIRNFVRNTPYLRRRTPPSDIMCIQQNILPYGRKYFLQL